MTLAIWRASRCGPRFAHWFLYTGWLESGFRTLPIHRNLWDATSRPIWMTPLYGSMW
jgi:hypothetical protein